MAAAGGVVQAAVRALDEVELLGLMDGGADAGCDPGGVELFVGGGEAGAVGAAGGEERREGSTEGKDDGRGARGHGMSVASGVRNNGWAAAVRLRGYP